MFFAGFDGGIVVIDGTTITLGNDTAGTDSVLPPIAAGLTFSENGYAATFAAVGEERSTSIESADQDVTLAVSTPDGRSTRIDGVLGCGV